MSSIKEQDFPKRKFRTAPQIPRVSPGVLKKTTFDVRHEGTLIVLECRQGTDTISLTMDAETAAWISTRLRLHARRARRLAGAPAISLTMGLLSDAEHDYKYGLDRDRT